MKFKYFLRGLGAGIIFASIVLLTAYKGNPSNKMTDAEIIERAKSLGMVEKEDTVKKLLSTESDKSENNTENDITETEQDLTKESEDTTKQQSMKDNEITKEDAATTDSGEMVMVTIGSGDSSYQVAQKLQEAGLITDASEFDSYLVENGYANRIRVGEHELKKGMDFHELAESVSEAAK